MVLRGVAGSDEKEFKKQLQSQIDTMLDKVNEVNAKVTDIQRSVANLLQQMNLTRLDIAEGVVGSVAYAAMQFILVKYQAYEDRLKRISNTAPGPQGFDSALAKVRNSALTPYFTDLIFNEKLDEKCLALLTLL
jgi:hypothetical protein